MSVALPEQLNYERSMPLSGGAKQQMAVALPITDAGSYQLGSTFVINIPAAQTIQSSTHVTCFFDSMFIIPMELEFSRGTTA